MAQRVGLSRSRGGANAGATVDYVHSLCRGGLGQTLISVVGMMDSKCNDGWPDAGRGLTPQLP